MNASPQDTKAWLHGARFVAVRAGARLAYASTIDQARAAAGDRIFAIVPHATRDDQVYVTLAALNPCHGSAMKRKARHNPTIRLPDDAAGYGEAVGKGARIGAKYAAIGAKAAAIGAKAAARHTGKFLSGLRTGWQKKANPHRPTEYFVLPHLKQQVKEAAARGKIWQYEAKAILRGLDSPYQAESTEALQLAKRAIRNPAPGKRQSMLFGGGEDLPLFTAPPRPAAPRALTLSQVAAYYNLLEPHNEASAERLFYTVSADFNEKLDAANAALAKHLADPEKPYLRAVYEAADRQRAEIGHRRHVAVIALDEFRYRRGSAPKENPSSGAKQRARGTRTAPRWASAATDGRGTRGATHARALEAAADYRRGLGELRRGGTLPDRFEGEFDPEEGESILTGHAAALRHARGLRNPSSGAKQRKRGVRAFSAPKDWHSGDVRDAETFRKWASENMDDQWASRAAIKSAKSSLLSASFSRPQMPNPAGAMTLLRFPANAAWAFVFGSDPRTMRPIPMGDYGVFFQDRKHAVEAARLQGLTVSASGNVTAKAR